MDQGETEARNDCPGEGQQQFNRPTDESLMVNLGFSVMGPILHVLHGCDNCRANIYVCIFFIMRPSCRYLAGFTLDSPESDDRIASVNVMGWVAVN
jgi:hypothetical protein